MDILRSDLAVASYPQIDSSVLTSLQQTFTRERVTIDNAYNAIAKAIGLTYADVKQFFPEFLLAFKLEKPLCVLFNDNRTEWGYYTVGDRDECLAADLELRKKIAKGLNVNVTQTVAPEFTKYERPKDFVQFVVAIVANTVATILAGVIVAFQWPVWSLIVLILVTGTSIYFLGGWKLRR
jgi:hypothetical protein